MIDLLTGQNAEVQTGVDGQQSNAEVRAGIYSGKVFRIAATPASLSLVAAVEAALAAEFPGETPHRKLQFELPGDELFKRIGKLRAALLTDATIRERLFALLREQGFAATDNAVDLVRLRAVTHLGHENPLAAPAYTAHRDTWYANSQAQVNWWIPLHDVTEADTFAFYPNLFDKPVANNSGDFDYDEWMKTVGWQSTSGKRAVYPTADTADYDTADGVPFACNKGDIILFSAAHLHQTRKNASGLTRFSIDFRSVNLVDEAEGKGAINVDNASHGSAVKDYVNPEQ